MASPSCRKSEPSWSHKRLASRRLVERLHQGRIEVGDEALRRDGRHVHDSGSGISHAAASLHMARNRERRPPPGQGNRIWRCTRAAPAVCSRVCWRRSLASGHSTPVGWSAWASQHGERTSATEGLGAEASYPLMKRRGRLQSFIGYDLPEHSAAGALVGGCADRFPDLDG